MVRVPGKSDGRRELDNLCVVGEIGDPQTAGHLLQELSCDLLLQLLVGLAPLAPVVEVVLEELRVCEAERADDALPLWAARRVYIAVDRGVAMRQPGVVARSVDLVDERRGPLLSPSRVVLVFGDPVIA